MRNNNNNNNNNNRQQSFDIKLKLKSKEIKTIKVHLNCKIGFLADFLKLQAAFARKEF